jgi:hypothetical protein
VPALVAAQDAEDGIRGVAEGAVGLQVADRNGSRLRDQRIERAEAQAEGGLRGARKMLCREHEHAALEEGGLDRAPLRVRELREAHAADDRAERRVRRRDLQGH